MATLKNEGTKQYTCPMHPDVLRTRPGMCHICGMQLVLLKTKQRKTGRRGRGAHLRHTPQMFLKKFWVSFVLTIPVVFYSDILTTLFDFKAPVFIGSALIPPLLGTIVFFYGGLVFLTSAIRELRAKMPGMMTLIALAITTAYSYSMFVVFTGKEGALFWELTSLVTVMLLGHYLEMRAVGRAKSALTELSELIPDTAEVVRNGESKTIPVKELRVGDTVFVRPGARIPADGVVTEGDSTVNESIATGESAPVAKTVGSEVIGGTINEVGALSIRVVKVGENTFLAGVARLVAEAEASKSRLQILSDRAAFYLTITAIGAGAVTFFVWLPTAAGAPFALERLVAVLVVACPHALGLAVPLVASISTALAAKNGFLVRKRIALESARAVDIVVFDKTGTLTRGSYGVTGVIPFTGMDEAELLTLAASIDARSEHSASRAIVDAAKRRGAPLKTAENFSSIPGKGVVGRIGSNEIAVGGEAILSHFGTQVPSAHTRVTTTEARRGKTIIYVVKNGAPVGAMVLSDTIRNESREAVRRLRDMHVRVSMLTGDSVPVAAWVAEELGISEYFAGVLPQDKAEKIKLLQSRGHTVAMVGDGINDAPALAQADLGIAVGAGTNIAIESAGIVLAKNDPRDIPKIIRLSRITFGKMLQNLFWASGYNIVAIPLAAGAFAFVGFTLEPAFAALLMSFSTVIVALNALTMRRKRLE